MIGELWRTDPKKVVTSWFLLSVFIGILGLLIDQKTILPGPATLETLLSSPIEQAAFKDSFKPKDSLLIILRGNGQQFDSEKHIALRNALVSDLRALKDASGTNDLFEKIQTIDHTWLDSDLFRSADGKYSLIIAESKNSLDKSAKDFAQLPQIFAEWSKINADFELRYLSEGTFSNQIFELIDRDLDASLIYTVPITFIILLWAFGSFVAALVPMLMAIVSLFCSLGVSAIFSHILWPISATASQLVVLLVLAIGIDYSLFMLSRVREEIQNGSDYYRAIAIARSSTGLAIMWSGLTVAISLFGLFLMPDSVLTSMALVSIISVLITVLGSLFVLPSVLLLLCDKIEYGRLRTENPNSLKKLGCIDLSVKYPVLTIVLSSGLLLSLAYFSVFMKLGSTMEPAMFPANLQSAQAYASLKENFPELAGVEFSLLLQADKLNQIEDRGDLQPFMNSLLSMPGVKGPLRVAWSENQTLARYSFIAGDSANLINSQEIVHKLRSKLFPEYLLPLGIQADVGGTLPYVVDNIDRYSSKTPAVFLAVLALSFLFLLIAFRSIVIPIKAMILNVMSTAASFGVLVITFQFLTGSSWNYGVIESFVPALLFSILFGLSMDYHVFLLSRVSEEVKKGRSTSDSVRIGIQQTSKTITSAALIMVSVFAIIATLHLPIMKELGVGLAFAIFIDATVVRSMLLPASMVLLGKWNWYFPKCFEFIPKIKLD